MVLTNSVMPLENKDKGENQLSARFCDTRGEK